MYYTYSTLSEIGLKRQANEDSVGVFKVANGLLIIVCDGLGGNKAGDVASKLTVEVIQKYFQASAEDDYLERIKNAITEANKIVMEQSDGNINYKGMATTVEVLFLKDHEVYWGHIGDSRIYYFRNGKLKQLTKDHSLVQKLVDEGFLTLKEAENHPNKNIIIRALGDSDTIDIDLSKLRINSQDETKFFVCSDGVTTVIHDEELEQILRIKNPDLISQNISHIVMERGAPDNYSFVIILKTE